MVRGESDVEGAKAWRGGWSRARVDMVAARQLDAGWK